MLITTELEYSVIIIHLSLKYQQIILQDNLIPVKLQSDSSHLYHSTNYHHYRIRSPE